jgi:hypothetical protein
VFFEFVAATFATIHFKKYRFSKEKYFIYFLWYTFLTELTSSILGWCFQYNFVVAFIIYDFVSFLFYMFWFYSILNKKLNKKVIYFMGSFFIIVAVLDFIFQDWQTTNKYTFICGAFIIIISSLLYFSELLKSDKILYLKSELGFWIAIGLLLFNVGFVPIEIFKDTFNSISETRIVITICLNIILYTCYSLGFIWVRKEKVV